MRRTAQLLTIVHVIKATNIEYNRGDCEIFSREWSCADGVPIGQSPPPGTSPGARASYIAAHGHACWQLSAEGQTCGQICGGDAFVDVDGTRVGSSDADVVNCLEYAQSGLVTTARHNLFVSQEAKDEVGRDCEGIHLFVPSLVRWHCFPQFTPLYYPNGFRGPCLCYPPPPPPPTPPSPPSPPPPPGSPPHD